jgi:hypothetical protein
LTIAAATLLFAQADGGFAAAGMRMGSEGGIQPSEYQARRSQSQSGKRWSDSPASASGSKMMS